MLGMQFEHVDAMRIVQLCDRADGDELGGNFATDKGWQFGIQRQGYCTSAQKLLIESLWNEIPDGETARCHVPGFAIEAFIEQESVFRAAICWVCNNVSIGGSYATIGWRHFEASSPKAQHLLALCEEVVCIGLLSPVA